jgi:murein hydrolase activator
MCRTDMKEFIKLFFVLFLWLLLAHSDAFSQSRAELERQREETRREIEYTRQLINETTEQHEATVSHLNLLQQKIRSRESLINNYNTEIDLLSAQIETNSAVVNSLERDLEALRSEYAEMIRMAHRNRLGNNITAFIFGAESLTQAYKRIQFLRHYSERRQRQAELIELTRATLADRVSDLQKQQDEQRALLEEVNRELQTLESDRQNQASLLNTLEGKEEELRKELREKEQTAERLNRAIDAIIQREMEEARRRQEQEARQEIPEDQRTDVRLSRAFEENKAKLPWPVERGFITQTFGKHEHPTLRGVYINNNGIDIQTGRGEQARAVFSGEVSRVVNIPGAHYAIIVRHGEYFTVYSNLGSVLVEPGQKVETGAVVGEIVSNPSSGETVLHFEIWKNRQKLNPEHWLYKN